MIGEESIVATYTPKVRPRFFFKPVGDASKSTHSKTSGSQIAFVGSDPAAGADRNYVYDLDSGALTPIPGSLDPIGLFGTSLISVPLEDEQGRLHLAFYDLRARPLPDFAAEWPGSAARSLLPPDRAPSGRYQSMGVLARKGTRVRFRMITDGHEGGDFRDYEADFGPTPATLRALSATRPLCPNLRRGNAPLKLKLPMISKDGKSLGAFDLATQQMRIFALDSKGWCTEREDALLGRGDVGKVDFSADATQVAFHFSDRSLQLSPITFGVPEPAWQLRSAIFDLRDQSYRMLPFFGKGVQTYYPAFLPNGHVLVLKADAERTEFVEVDPEKLKRVSRSTIERYARLSEEAFAGIRQLSQSWMEQCFLEADTSHRKHRVLSLFSMTRAQCLSLARKNHLERVCDALEP
jgi:hypothetical protein